MSTKITDDQGNEFEVYTAEELKAQADAAVAAREAVLKTEHDKVLADKDAHVAQKLAEFQQANKGVDAEKDAVKLLAEDAKRIAEEAKTSIAKAEGEALTVKKNYWIRSIVGDDPELTKKIQDNYDLINLPATNDKEISERVQRAVNMAGIGSVSGPSNISFSGGAAPNTIKTEASVADHNYHVWVNELGLQDYSPKQK